MTDERLLARYVEMADGEAFAELVRRHVGVVYSAAMRQLGDRGLAEDVTQGVFLLLAQKARRVCGNLVVGWLLKATFYACRDVRKRERRRRFHEERAMEMRAEPSTGEAREPAWAEVGPVVDEAMMRLSEGERTAVGLRVLEGRRWEEVAAAVGVGEEAARKQVRRALEKLRAMLVQRGVAAPAAGVLAVLLAERGAEAVPPGLAGAVAGGGSAGARVIAHATGKGMTMAKVKAAAMAAAGMVAVGAVVGAAWSQAMQGRNPVVVAAATAAAPPALAPTRVAAVGDVWRGILVDPQGKAVAGAAYQILTWADGIGYQRDGQGRTGADGRFGLRTPTKEKEWARVFYFDVPGYAWACWQPRADLFGREVEQRIVLEKPAVVAGKVVDEAGEGIAGAQVDLRVQTPLAPGAVGTDVLGLGVRTDGQGAFRFDRMPESGKAGLEAKHAGYLNYSTSSAFPDSPFPVAAGTQEVVVKMAAGGSVRVQLMREGKRWEQPDVRVSVYSKQMRTRVRALTDAGGTALAEGLAPGEGVVTVDTRKLAALGGTVRSGERVEVVAGKTTEASLVVETGRMISGRLVDDVTGKGMKGEIAVVTRPEGLVVASGTAAEDGTFSARAPEGGDYVVTYSGYTPEGGGQDKTFEAAVASRGAVEGVVLRARARPELRGRLVDKAGKPVVGRVVVEFWGADTDGEGRFSMRAPSVLDRGDIAVAFDRERKLGRGFIYRVGDEAKELVLTLEPMGAIEGQVTVEGKGAGAEVELQTYISTGSSAEGPHEWVWDKQIQADGKFRIAPVPVGCEIALHVARPGAWGDAGTVKLAAGETRELGEVPLTGAVAGEGKATGTVEGSVVDREGKPVVGADISVLMVQGLSDFRNPTTDVNGHFVVKGLPAGREVMLATQPEGCDGASWKGEAGAKGVVLKVEPQGYALWGKAAPALAVSEWVIGTFNSWGDLKGKVVILQTGQNYRTYVGQRQDVRELYKKYKKQGLEVVWVQAYQGQATKEQVIAWAKEQGITWPVGMEAGEMIEPGVPGSGEMWPTFGGQGNYVIDKQGMVRASVRGENLEEWVKKLLAE